MELVLRCSLPDRPGALARVASAVAEFDVDIEAVEVVDVVEGHAIDDIVVVAEDPRRIQQLLEHLAGVDHVEVIHSGPSRGHPGDAVSRAAVGLQALLDGSVEAERGTITLVGGLLRAEDAEITDDPPSSRDARLVVPLGDRWLVLSRSYAFTDTERHRAEALARVAATARPDQVDSAAPS